MSERELATVIDPGTARSGDQGAPYPFDLFERSALAQGDSWFSMGAIPPTRTTRVLAELRLRRSTVIVNCARPGAVLRRMTDTTTERNFLDQLAGRTSRRWDVLLLSGGGNDLIDAAGTGADADPAHRLFLTAAERGSGALAPADYLSADGWDTFANHIGSVFHRLVDIRDGSSHNARTPLVWHNYARVRPTPSGAGLGFGPWLLPAMQRYAIPDADQLPVADEMIARLGALVVRLTTERLQADPAAAIFVADSQSAGLVLAEPGATGESGDWINEIHPSRSGYRKAATAWQAVLDPLLG